MKSQSVAENNKLMKSGRIILLGKLQMKSTTLARKGSHLGLIIWIPKTSLKLDLNQSQMKSKSPEIIYL